jgi:hypothetical protein
MTKYKFWHRKTADYAKLTGISKSKGKMGKELRKSGA